MLALGRDMRHQVMQMVSICLEHTRETPHVRALRLLYKAHGHHEQRVDDGET